MHVKSMEAMVATLPFALGPNLPVLTAVFGPPAVAEVTVAALNTLHCTGVRALDSSHSGRLLIACAHAAQIPNTASSASSRFGPQRAQKKKVPEMATT